MPFPGEWIDFSFPGGGDAPPQPCSSNNDIVPRAYHPSENLPLRLWDPQRLAEHVSAVMSSDIAPAAVEFIIGDQITGSFLFHYTNQIDEVISKDKNKCELTRRIARIVPFWIPRRREQFSFESYSLPRLVEDLDAKFCLCDTSLVAGEEVEIFDWEDEPPSPSTLPRKPGSERPDPDPAEEHGQDIFTSPALLEMGFHGFSTAPALSQPTVQMPTTHVTRRLAPTRTGGTGGADEPSPGRKAEEHAHIGGGCAQICPGAFWFLLHPLFLHVNLSQTVEEDQAKLSHELQIPMPVQVRIGRVFRVYTTADL
ncbi:hypothetical protein EDB87DRAFT_1575166 [Lactarius vividus]|nr:hypothetical protein EDB87DRAFT_1575166 [Lactarius vividus]